MTARERLNLEFGGISSTIRDYTSNGNIINYLDGMTDAIESKDEDKIQYFGINVLEWYKRNIEIIRGNENDLQKAYGIGPKRARRIFDIVFNASIEYISG